MWSDVTSNILICIFQIQIGDVFICNCYIYRQKIWSDVWSDVCGGVGRGKLPWREAGPPNHHDDKVDSDQ